MTARHTELADRIKAEARRLGFDRAGIAPVRESDHGEFYRRWLAESRHGEMHYLARPGAVERRLDPRAAFHGVRSALVVAHNHYPGDNAGAEDDPSRGIVARYARGRDYHRVVKKQLMRLLRWLEDELGRELSAARAYVDTGPVLERELARRAGIGWFGRNTMLIDPGRGSYFFIGVLLLDLELPHDEPFEADRCGTCRACLDACPTGALLGRDEHGGPVMDARRCISYLTIELRGPIPRELRPLIGNRVFGCDICQEVCPFNNPRFVQLTDERDYTHYSAFSGGADAVGSADSGAGRVTAAAHSNRPDADGDAVAMTAPLLIRLLRMDEHAWDRFSRGRAVRRAKRSGFLRNVAVALGNWGAPEAVPVLVDALADEEPLVRGHAAWALGRIGTAEARGALEERAGVEADGWVREEVARALERSRPRPEPG